MEMGGKSMESIGESMEIGRESVEIVPETMGARGKSASVKTFL